MAMVDTLERREGDTLAGGPHRQVGRRRALPNSRAVVGALLITLSVFGIFWSWSAANRPPSTMYVVAAADLVVGDTIERDDLALATADLPGELGRSAAFTSFADVVGSVVVGPLRKGELVQAGAVARQLGNPGMREMAFAIEESRALAGRLRPGQRIDVLATFGSGSDTYTTAVVRDALVLRIERSTSALGTRGGLTVTLGLEQSHDPLALAHALNVGDVFIVGATSAADPSTGASERVYRAPHARDSAEATR